MKKYRSKEWLRLRYEIQGRTPQEIAKECNVAPMTIYRVLKEFGLMKGKR